MHTHCTVLPDRLAVGEFVIMTMHATDISTLELGLCDRVNNFSRNGDYGFICMCMNSYRMTGLFQG